MKIEVIKLNKEYMARPEGNLGNVGWTPFAWTACYASTAAQALRKFEQVHAKQIAEYVNK